MNRRLLLALPVCLALALPVSAAQWPHCATFGPSVVASLHVPAGFIPTQLGQAPITLRQGEAYLAGSAFNWITGQLPRDITVEFVSWSQAPTGQGFAAAGTVARTIAYPLLHRPDVSAHALATNGWKVSPYTGFALYFIDVPPLNTRFIRVTYGDPFCLPTSHNIPVTIVP